MDYSKKRKVKISMEGYLREVLEEYPEEIIGRAKTPAATHLFEVQSNEDQIQRSWAFYHSSIQLPFTSTRCRKEIHTVVALLTKYMRAH